MLNIHPWCSVKSYLHGKMLNIHPSTENPELAGQKYNIQDRGVFNYHGDMYLTTTQKDHRTFTK